MILSAGLTPAWQQIMVFRGFRYGEVNRAAEVHWQPRARSSTRASPPITLAGRASTLARWAALPAGNRPELAALGVPRRWVVTRAATRVCTTILDRRERHNDRTGRERPAARCRRAGRVSPGIRRGGAKASVAVLAGSLPAGTPERSIASWSGRRVARWCWTSAARACWAYWTAGRWWSSRIARSWPRPWVGRWTMIGTVRGHAVAECAGRGGS